MLIPLILIPFFILAARLIFIYILREDLTFKINIKELLKFHKINLRNNKLKSEISVKYYFSIILSIIFGILVALIYQNLLTQYISSLELVILFIFILSSSLILLYLSIFDILFFEIPLRVIYFYLTIVMLMNIIFVILKMLGTISVYLGNLSNLIGGILLGGIFYLVVKLTKERGMGMGDVYLMVGIGLSLGVTMGLVSYLATLLIASAFGVIYAIVKKDFKQVIIPLVPFISLGFLIALALNNSFIKNIILF